MGASLACVPSRDGHAISIFNPPKPSLLCFEKGSSAVPEYEPSVDRRSRKVVVNHEHENLSALQVSLPGRSSCHRFHRHEETKKKRKRKRRENEPKSISRGAVVSGSKVLSFGFGQDSILCTSIEGR